MRQSIHPFLNTAISAAHRAGDMILRAMNRQDTIEVASKAAHDFVTNIDMQSEQMLVESLHEAYPEHNFLTEEQGEIKHSDQDIVWIIDPIDGTTNFIHGYPQFCISIACLENGKLTHALIYNPVTQDLFTASRGGGAYHNQRRIRVSQLKTLDNALLSLGMPRSAEYFDLYTQAVDKVHTQISGIRHSGATALNLAYVAAGMSDACWATNQKPWDIAAGILLIQEAGGLVIDHQGQENMLTQGNCIAANPKLIRHLVPLFCR